MTRAPLGNSIAAVTGSKSLSKLKSTAEVASETMSSTEASFLAFGLEIDFLVAAFTGATEFFFGAAFAGLTLAFLGAALTASSAEDSLAFAFDTVAMIDLALGQTLNPCQVLRPERASNN